MDPDSDPDSDPAIVITDLQNAKKTFKKKISAYYFLKEHLHNFSSVADPGCIFRIPDPDFYHP
jgi:hypothetical protein